MAPSSPSGPSRARPQPPVAPASVAGRSIHSHSSHGPPVANSRRFRAPPAPGGEFDRSLPSKTPSNSTATATENAEPAGSRGEIAAGPSKGRTLFNPGGPPERSLHGGSNGTRSVSSAGRRDRQMAPPVTGNHALPNQVLSSSSMAPIVINPHPGDRQLFDPRLHDPVRFSAHSRNGAPSVSSNSTGTTGTTHLHSNSSASQSTALSSIHEPGDRERERRKRREGSERKSSQKGGDRDETKSRSSEGSESLKDRQRGKGGDTGVLGALRERYRGIQTLEASLIDVHRRMGRDETVTLGNEIPVGPGMGDDGWVELISRHMKLAHAHHDFLTESLDPRLPASLHSLPVKYNIPARLWQNGFHLLIERMRTTWLVPSSMPSRDLSSDSVNAASATSASARALEHLTDYILDAYSFYTALLDENVVSTFRSAWIEALGDLARYKMAVANHVALTSVPTVPSKPLLASLARIDEDEPPVPSGNSIGKEVSDSWDVEDRETWRTTARDWYAMGVAEKPGEGRLHHRLALISRDVKGDEQRALYHFSKSLITNNPFASSRESILPLFDSALQSKRFHPDANVAELFVLLHGMIFTKIQLDDFDDIFARFFERLEEDRLGQHPLSQVEWIQMGIINLAACLQYGVEDGLLKKAGAEESARKTLRKDPLESNATPQAIMVHGAKRMITGEEDVGGSDGASDEHPDANGHTPTGVGEGEVRSLVKHAFSAEDEESLPLPFRHALRLSFAILSFCLAHPVRKDRLDNSILNPYITIFLTFLSTIIKQPAALALVERSVPWSALVSFFNTIPRKIEVRVEVSPKLTGGGPLPEDWCLRGMEWVGRRVFERGFWKQKQTSDRFGAARSEGPRSSQTIASEMDVLQIEPETADAEQSLRDGIVDGETDNADAQDLTARRWRRVAWSLGVFVRHVAGFGLDSSGRKVKIIEGETLDSKMVGWEKERVKAREAIEARIRRDEEARGEWADADSGLDGAEEDEYSDEDDEDDPDLRELKAQRRHLRSILSESRVRPRGPRPAKTLTASFAGLSHGRTAARPTKSAAPRNVLPPVLAGYTVLVFDTNVLLSSLDLFTATVESNRWTVMVPLPVITELDGLSNQPAPLGTEALKALTYLTTHIRTHSRTLKVQTSRGNYLADLTIRAEDITFELSNAYNPEKARDMDDLILRACSFQEEHFVDRTGILRVNDDLADEERQKSTKVVLMTFDRNLRLRARARGVESVDEKGMKKVLAGGG